MLPHLATALYANSLTMWNKLFLLLVFGMVSIRSSAQITDSSYVAIDSLVADTTAVDVPDNVILNAVAIREFYAKLADLEQNRSRKINIVHIGDSHIQADLMTGKVRRLLQEQFGNGGRGFQFPHSLARTNGSSDIRWSSNANWESYRNIYSPNGSAVGLSGIALATRSADFAIELNIKEDSSNFTTIKLVTPENEPFFALATERKTIIVEKEIPKKITHKIRSGEALSIIADKYNVGLTALKKANGLKSNNIRAGRTLKIPGNQTQQVQTEKYEYTPISLLSEAECHYFKSAEALDKIYIIPNGNSAKRELSGIILENDSAGILYHNIGVNGAKLSDYNKYPLFFDQLSALHADLIVVSLGTNESFDKNTTEEYMVQLRLFLVGVRKENPTAAILVLTPPPSLFQRRYPNTFAASYSKAISESAESDGFAVWDMYSQLGGLYGVQRNAKNGIIGSDRVHYTKAGYETQGGLFVEGLLGGYSDFKTGRK
jgi:LysM repeat protein